MTAPRPAAPVLDGGVAAPGGPAFAIPLAIGVTVLAWASAFVVIRAVGETFSPGPLALIRLLVGAAALGLFQLGRPWVRPTGREWAFLAAFGVLWFGGYNVLLNFSELTLDAGTASMVVNVGPLLLAVGATVVLREKLTRPLVVGGLVSFVGVLVIGLSTGTGGLDDTIGVLAAVAAAVVYAGGVLFQKPVLARLPAIQVTFLGAVFGAVVCLPFAPALAPELAVASSGAITGAVYLGLVPTALAFSTWAYALQRMPAARLGVTTYLVPPIAIGLALAAFGEVPGQLAIFGGILCLGGVALSRRR